MEIPFWGYRNFGALEEDGVKGSARLVLPDGTQLRPDDRRSADLEGYDYRAAKTQSCDLYFDGLPQGVTQAELQFRQTEPHAYNETPVETVLAAFTINLTNGTVVPSQAEETAVASKKGCRRPRQSFLYFS